MWRLRATSILSSVSVNTVKTQVQSIFRKLEVNNRQEARDAARQLKLR